VDELRDEIRPFIADSSPLILLARLGRLVLLPALAGKVFVPESVLVELRAGSHRDGAASVVEKAPGIEVVPDLPLPPPFMPGISWVDGSWAVVEPLCNKERQLVRR
jgi:hypothetical protein